MSTDLYLITAIQKKAGAGKVDGATFSCYTVASHEGILTNNKRSIEIIVVMSSLGPDPHGQKGTDIVTRYI